MNVWSDINNVDNLKRLGSLREVKQRLSDDLQMRISAQSWEQLLGRIKVFQQVFSGSETKLVAPVSSESSVSDLPYFRSETDRAIFILVETDGRCRQRLLGVTPIHYGNPELAKQWMRGLAKLVHPDKTAHPCAKDAMSNLDEMYREMISR